LLIERLGVWSGGCEILRVLVGGKVGFRGVGGGDGGKWRRLHGGMDWEVLGKNRREIILYV